MCEDTVDELEAELYATSATLVSEEPCLATSTPTSTTAPRAQEGGELDTNLYSSCKDIPEENPTPTALGIEEAHRGTCMYALGARDYCIRGGAWCRTCIPRPDSGHGAAVCQAGERQLGRSRLRGSLRSTWLSQPHKEQRSTRRPTFPGKVTKKTRYNPPPSIPLDGRRKKPS